MNAVLNNKDLFNKIKSYMYYTDKQIKKFKSLHYFFHQHKLNEEIKWVGFILQKNDVDVWDCLDENKAIIYTHVLFQ